MTDKSQIKWIGLVEVFGPRNKTLSEEKPKGAFVNVIALACSEQEFFSRVREALEELGFDILDLEDVEPYAERTKKYKIDPKLKEMAAKIDSKNPIGFGTFHMYRPEVE